MKMLITIALLLSAGFASAETIQIERNGTIYNCNPDGGGDYLTCAEVSLKKNGYVISDCSKVENDAQDICAGHSIEKNGYVISDCLKLIGGGRCAIYSMSQNGYIVSDCMRVQNSRQDRCAAASLRANGYVTSDCLR